MSGSLRVLVIHNRYTLRGGEDTVVEQEVAALRERGHEVELLLVDNHDPTSDDAAARARAATHAIWSRDAAARISRIARELRPDIAHVHNHAYELSASIFPALARAGVPTVATLHNYRMTCSATYLLRDDRPCELCVGSRASWQGIRHRCFRGSRAGSTMLAGMQLAWRRAAVPNVARWIVLTEFGRTIFERAHLPAERLVVRPNFVRDPGAGAHPRDDDAPIVFVGRLERSKGLDVLLRAWGDGIAGSRLLVIGDGPLREELQRSAPASVRILGELPRADVDAAMRTARAVVVPSRWYEGFGLVAIEAFAAATPVIASDLGALAQVVPAPECGWRVPAGDPAALRTAISAALDEPDEARERGLRARRHYEQHYTQDVVMTQLEQIYRTAIAHAD